MMRTIWGVFSSTSPLWSSVCLERRAESGLRHEKVGVSLLGRENQQGVCVSGGGSAAGAVRGVIVGKMAVKAADLTYYGRRSFHRSFHTSIRLIVLYQSISLVGLNSMM